MTPDQLLAGVRSGGQLLNAGGKYVDSIDRPLQEVFASPHYMGLTREVALSRPGSLVGFLFVREAPRFGFRPSEQRLLLAALQGGTDEDLARTLEISISGVKKTWGSIYDRVSAQSHGLIPDQVPEELTSERGKEKKQRLLAYLREHPEELRPATL